MPAFWESTPTSRQTPATTTVLITPADSNLAANVKALRVANKGATWLDVAVITVGGNTITLSFPPGLSVEPIAIAQVKLTGTSSDPNLVIHGYVA